MRLENIIGYRCYTFRGVLTNENRLLKNEHRFQNNCFRVGKYCRSTFDRVPVLSNLGICPYYTITDQMLSENQCGIYVQCDRICKGRWRYRHK